VEYKSDQYGVNTMQNDELVKTYCEARDYLSQNIEEKVDVFLTGIWDPLIKYVLIKETSDIINKELTELFPVLPSKYLPKCRFRIFEDDAYIEAGIQQYFNTRPNLVYLGTNDLGSTSFDYYMKDVGGTPFDARFIARYGHDEDSVIAGSKTAEAEYYMGAITPLSVAYGMAIEDGFIT